MLRTMGNDGDRDGGDFSIAPCAKRGCYLTCRRAGGVGFSPGVLRIGARVREAIYRSAESGVP